MKFSFEGIRGFVLILYLLCSLHSEAQETYLAGFSKVSIEPQSFPFSLALAGYGAPAEGRFTLEWVPKADNADYSVFAGSDEKLFSVQGNNVMIAEGKKELNWKPIGKAEGVKILAANGKKLYSVDLSGNIKSCLYGQQLRWKRIGMFPNARAIAVLDGNIYVADNNGMIHFSSLKKNTLTWKSLSSLANVQSITGYEGRLYALTSEDNLFALDLGKDPNTWLKIARYNGISYDVKIKSITIVRETLYGLDAANNLFTGRHQSKGDLSVTALAVASNKQRVVLVGADLCGFDHDFISSLKGEIFKKHGISPAAILINASHTHFAPVTQRWSTWAEHNQKPDSNYLYSVVRPALISVIEEAIQNFGASEIYFGRGKTGIGRNRSLTTGTIPYDDDVDVLHVVEKKDGRKTVLFLTGCHPVANNQGVDGLTISPNYPGIARSSLQRNSAITNAMFIQGCGGDINPVDWNYVKTGEELASEVQSVLDNGMQKLEGELSFHMDSLSFPVNRWSNEDLVAFKDQNSNREGDVYAEKNVRWADLMLTMSKKDRMPTKMPVYIQTINIGNWKLIGLSREAVTDYSIGIKQLWPHKLVSVAGYCNDVSSYLPTERHIEAKVYEGDDSFFWYAQPSVFPDSVYKQILNKIKNQAR